MEKINKQITNKKVKFKGTETFINSSTGELVEMQVTDIEERDFNFHKLWLKNIINTLDLVGNQKTRLAFWIVEHLDKENQLTLTYRQICEEYKKTENQTISLDTVAKTMTILLNSDFMRRKNGGCYIVNPDIVFKGTRTGRLNVLNQYRQAEKVTVELTKEQEIKNLTENMNALQKAMERTLERIQALQNADEGTQADEQGEEYTNTRMVILSDSKILPA